MKADLHIHSCFSFDATNTVSEIVDLACAKGLDYIAVSDHNQYRGALELAKNSRINSISAIEIDCYFNNEIIHLLGYGIDLNDPFYEKLYNHYKNELARIGEIRLKLIEEKHNIRFDREKLLSLTHGGYSFTNVELTKLLLEDYKDHKDMYPYVYGDKKSNPLANYYWDNLAHGKWGYVEMDLPDYTEIIDNYHRTKGVCIVAHPIIGVKRDLSLVRKLLNAGVDGFEAYSSYHDIETIEFYKDICKSKSVLWTCGSDYHGINKPNIKLGDTKHDQDDDIWLKPLLDKISQNN